MLTCLLIFCCLLVLLASLFSKSSVHISAVDLLQMKACSSNRRLVPFTHRTHVIIDSDIRVTRTNGVLVELMSLIYMRSGAYGVA